MRIKKIVSPFIAVAAFGLFILASSLFGQGRYANVYSRAQVNEFVRQLEQSSDQFHTDFRREVSNSDLSNSTRRTYNNYADQFENAVDKLRRRFDSSDSWWQSRNEVRDMISNSQNLNTTMNSASFRRRIERQWNRLRDDINKLADTYDLPGLNGGGWNGGPGYPDGSGIPPIGGGDRDQIAPPSWARGTFYGTAPNGTRVILTISNNGRVTANVGGPIAYGSFTRGNYLNMGDSISRVTQQRDGFVTTRVDNGERIVYSRDEYGSGGPSIPPGGGGNQISPPSWARGTFYGTAPNGTNIVLTIYANGNVSANIGGSMFNGRFTEGNYLDMGDSLSQVTRQGNGFLTTRTDNGERIYYRR